MMTDQEKICFLRSMGMMVGWSPDRPFEQATMKLEMTRGQRLMDYFLMSEIIELAEYYAKLDCMIQLGHIVTPADKFAYNILKANGVFNALSALYEAMENNDSA